VTSLIRKIRNNRFIGNTNWLIFQNIYSMGLSLIVGALSARYLGPSNYGLIGYGASLVNLFTSISQLGIDNVLINEMMKHPEEKGKVLGTALCMRMFSSCVSFVCAMILVVLIEPGNYVLWFITAIQAFAIALRAYELLNEWFLSEMKSKYYVIANMCGQTVVGVWKLVLLALQASVVWFAASTTVQALVCGSIVITLFLIMRDFKLGFRWQYAKDIFSRSKHYVFAGIAVSLYTQMDKVMVGRMLGETEVGIYTAAMTIAMLWEFIPTAIFNSSRTMILEAKTRNEEEYREKLKALFFGISVLGILVGIAVQIFGKLAVWILYGEEYMDAVPVLQLLIWSTTFAMIGLARNVWSVAEEKNKYTEYYPICGAIFNLIFNALAIPVWGIFGAALGTLLAQIIVALVAPMLWKDTRPFVKLYLESWGSWRYLMKWLKKE
jgi:O-antigen/teichoic acid export membrane protein